LALRGCCPLKFSYTLEIDQALKAHTQMGMRVPPKTFDRENLKIWPKIQRISPYNVGASGSILTTRRRDEFWSTNKKYSAHIDPPELHVHCNVTHIHTPRGSTNITIQFSESFASSHGCERHLDYLNWWRSIVVRTPVLAGKLSLSCSRLTAGRVTTLWVKRPLSVNQNGQLSQPSLRGRLNE